MIKIKNKDEKIENKIIIKKAVKDIFTKKCLTFFAISSLSSIIQVIGYILIVLLLPKLNSIVDNKDNYVFPNLNADMQVVALVSLMIGISIVSFLIGLLSNYYSVGFAKHVSMNLRNLVYSKIQSFSMADIETFSQSSLINRLTVDITTIATASESFSRLLVKSIFLYFGGLIGMIILVALPSQNSKIELFINSVNIPSYWIVLIIIGISLSLILVIVIISLFAYKWFHLGQKKLDKINNLMQENVLSQRSIKSFNLQNYQLQKFDIANEELRQTTTKSGMIMAAVLPSVYFFLDISLVLTTWLSNKSIIDKLVSLYLLMSIMIIALVLTIVGIIQINRSIPCFKRSFEIIKYKPLIKYVDKDSKIGKKKNIKFVNVSFKYPNSNKYSLKNINLNIEENNVIGIIGPTGSGKTTLMHLLVRMFDTTKGSINLCNTNIKNMTKHTLKSLVAFCPQNIVIFSGSLKSNLLFGNPNASDADMLKACNIANLSEFVQKQKDKLDLKIDQRGNNLSGGQKQRLAIARTLIKKSPFLLLDDATSALDMITEKQICDELLKNQDNQTIVISSQRINAIRNANKIIVMNKGKILAEGTHIELLKKCQYYRDVAIIQLGQKEVDNEINQK